MRKLSFPLAVSLLVASLVTAAAGAVERSAPKLEMYTITVSSEQAAQVATLGLDVAAQRATPSGVELDVVLSPRERATLRKLGVELQVARSKNGRSQQELAAAQSAYGFEVWRSWDEPGGIRDELYRLAASHPQIVKLVVLGHTHQGREIIGLKVTQGARGLRDGARPAVLYTSNQHAREWISVEVNRRLLHWFIDRWRANDTEVRSILRSSELWFVISANPDGYQYSFDHDRLWRKNLRDNDGDGVITTADGVDPNRNFDEHWKYDEEGSSSLISSQTYRGPAPASEPETQALARLLQGVRPRYQSNLHSFGDYILYPQGWQVGTPEADNPIYAALAGTDAHPAIPGFDPGISSDELYVTNGETTDFADTAVGTIAFTPELGEGCPGCGFVFPDDDRLIQTEFEDTLPFHLSLARSAASGTVRSSVGTELEPFYLEQTEVDPENAGLSMFDFTFETSYGDPQEVRVLAARELGPVTLRYRIEGGPAQSAPTSEWSGGEKYGQGNGTHYHVVRGVVTGTNPGDTVEVWFEGGGESSDPFTYEAVSESGNRVLVLAAEDTTGASPVQGPGPHYLAYYTDALTANGIGHDVYDIDAQGRVPAHALGVLSHYDAVVWYTGDDVVTRELGWGPGNASRIAMTQLLAVRDHLNEGGKLLYTGQLAGNQYSTNLGSQLFDPFENRQCRADPAILARCQALHGSGDLMNDVVQYWLGAGILNLDAGFDPDAGNPYDVVGVDTPYAGTGWGFNGPDSADNQGSATSFITTSGLLPASEYPQFESRVSARYDRPGGPFDPHSGERYVYSQIADVSYKRLTRTISVPETGATLSFWTSYNTEAHWDHLLVEARTVGGDDWTTLPDLNGHTSMESGDSCSSGWRELHPHLDHYQTLNPDGTCSPAGTTGSWHAASGSSGGWGQWQVDLASFAGRQVEVSIAYVSDWSVQGLGVFVDDITVSTGEGSTSFEEDLGGWAITGPPEGSGPNANNWERIDGAGFPEGAVVATDDTLYMGFGFEGVSGTATRADVMGRAMAYLLG